MKSNALQLFNQPGLSTAFPLSATALSSDGCPIAYWEGGNRQGPPIIFLHGFALDHSIWVKQFSDTALSSRFRLIAPDLRRHGASRGADHADGLSDASRWADDLAALIRSCELEKPIIVAWSFGGRMLNDYLKCYGSSTLAGINYVAAATLAYREAVGPGHAVLADLCTEEEAVRASACERLVGEVFGASPGDPAFRHLQKVVGLTAPDDRRTMRSRPLDYDEVLAALALPVLITHGDQDRFVFPCLATRLQQVLRSATVSHYSSSGHAPFFEEPARFNAELTAFVRLTLGR